MPPKVIGPYRVLETLGSGGVGTVYRSIDRRTGEIAALKLLSTGPALDPKAARRLAREFETLQNLSHPNVVKVYDTGVYQGYPYLAMELVEGLTLRHYLSLSDRRPGERPRAVAGDSRAPQPPQRAARRGRRRVGLVVGGRRRPRGVGRLPAQPLQRERLLRRGALGGVVHRGGPPDGARLGARAGRHGRRARHRGLDVGRAGAALRPAGARRGRAEGGEAVGGRPGEAEPGRAGGPPEGRDAADVRRAGVHPRARADPPRPEAVEHHGRRGPAGAADGLRAGQVSRRRRGGDRRRPAGRHLSLHGARADSGRERSTRAPTSTRSG